MVGVREEKVSRAKFLRESGISISDLHNWVARGLLPRWYGRTMQGNGGSVYYYPAWAVQRAADIKRLRQQGVSMQKIRKILAGDGEEDGLTYRQLRYAKQKLLRGEKVGL